MKTPNGDNRFNSRYSYKETHNAKGQWHRHFYRLSAGVTRRSTGTFTRIFICALALALIPLLRIAAQSAHPWHLPDIPWAFPIRDKVQPVLDDRSGPIHVPGSAKIYTQDQIDDIQNPPDWFPDEHAPMPRVVARGADGGVLGCASCHLGSGLRHPESANLAGGSAAYILRQLADFKAGNRIGEAMNDMAKNLSEEDAKQAAEWFAALKPKAWQKVIGTDRVPKTFVNEHLMRMPLPGGGDEPIGNLAKGKEFVTTGGGKTIKCAICHGPSLNGLGEVPAIAGHSPMYLFRQLYYFKDGSRHGSLGALMKGVVAQMTQDDMLAIAAYVGSLPPASEDSSTAILPGQTSVAVAGSGGERKAAK